MHNLVYSMLFNSSKSFSFVKFSLQWFNPRWMTKSIVSELRKNTSACLKVFRYLLFELEYILNKLLSRDYPNFISCWTMLSRNSTKKREKCKRRTKTKGTKVVTIRQTTNCEGNRSSSRLDINTCTDWLKLGKKSAFVQHLSAGIVPGSYLQAGTKTPGTRGRTVALWVMCATPLDKGRVYA